MPSLKQLEDFKTSFQQIGNEPAVLAERHSPSDDFSLPDAEPAPLPGSPDSAPVPAEPGPEEFSFPDITEPGESAGDIDFGAFLDTIPDDLSPPPVPDISDIPGIPDNLDISGISDIPAGLEELSGEAPAPEEDFNFPDTLLEGLAEDLEPEQAGGELPGETGAGDFSLSGMDETGPAGLADLPLPDGEDGSAPEDAGEIPEEEMLSLFSEDGVPSAPEPEASSGGAEDFSGGFDLREESALQDTGFPDAENSEEAGFDIGFPEETEAPDSPPEEPFNFNLPDETDSIDFFDKPEEAAEAGAGASASPEAESGDALPEDFSIPDFEAAGTGEADFSVPGGADFIDFGGESGGSAEIPDPFDGFNLEDNVPGLGTPGEAAPPGEGGFEDFSLAGIDDVFGAPPAGSAGAFQAASGEVEEINLSEDEFGRIQETLNSYPLNLRIACEELIAEQAVAPELMSALVKLLVRGASAKETAALAGKILGKTIPVPKGFEKKTGEELEAEQASFAYIFVRKFLPVFRVFLAIALAGVSLLYLIHRFIYTPLAANAIYKAGYQRIAEEDYTRANERFRTASGRHRMKKWYYRYAEAFRDARQYILAEDKYDELLLYYPRDKKGALDYADMETNYLRNYAKADTILRKNILDYAVDDQEGLIALGDNYLAWGEIDRSKYEDAREAFARLLERYGWKDPIVERMLLYFIRTDKLGEVLPLQQFFMNNKKSRISAPTLAELGGYLLDKQNEEVRGVPDENIGRIDGIRDILFRAVLTDPALPEAHYHLARYYNHFGNTAVERETLETALRAFDSAGTESAKRTAFRLDAERRYAQILINAREFFAAEEHLVKAAGIYEDGLDRRVLARSPAFGRLYADLGDLVYFTQDGNMEGAIAYYRRAGQNGWYPPEIRYRTGYAYYHLRQWEPALGEFFNAASELPLNRRILHALGNTAYMRGDYFAAQGYFNRLLDLLETERDRFPLLTPGDRPEHMQLAERIMAARNNLGVTLEALAENTGDAAYRSRALALYAESARAWDTITRNPDTMARMRPTDLYTPGINLGFLNSQNTLHPVPGYEPQLFPQIDKDVLEPSLWEDLAPPEYRLSG